MTLFDLHFLRLACYTLKITDYRRTGKLPRWLNGKNAHAKAGVSGDVDSIPGSGSSPGEGNGNSLKYSCWGNPMDRRAWRVTVLGVAKNQT